MRKIVVLALLIAVVATASLAVPAMSSPTATSAATTSVKVGDNYFVRRSGVPTVTVSRGTTVRWLFSGRRTHNVDVSRGPVKFSSPIKRRGSYSKKLTRKGTYTIICTIHGASDQSMKLVVR